MNNPIRFFSGVFAVLGLLICLVASLRVFFGFPSGFYLQDFAIYKIWLNWGTLLWFMMTPVWMFAKKR
ncbi:MAG: hypothetical protein JXR73_04480 [Candidatus Omnitrophica bacterium]|nr:hypothetical protein [Candidatus Omnitrophota bacterium]